MATIATNSKPLVEDLDAFSIMLYAYSETIISLKRFWHHSVIYRRVNHLSRAFVYTTIDHGFGFVPFSDLRVIF